MNIKSDLLNSSVLIHSFPILMFLLFSIYQIVLALKNCGIGNNDLGWIRVSFLVNIPFVLGVFIYLGVILIKKKIPSFMDFIFIIIIYVIIYFWYSVLLGNSKEFRELK